MQRTLSWSADISDADGVHGSPKAAEQPAGSAVRTRNLVAFAVLGVLNNVVFALSNASAGSVLPGAVGAVYMINTAPGLAIKLIAPLWITLGSYDLKIFLIGLSLTINLVVLLVPGVPTWMALLGIALGDTGSSAGEATCMALTQFYAEPNRHISYFALGTGFGTRPLPNPLPQPLPTASPLNNMPPPARNATPPPVHHARAAGVSGYSLKMYILPHLGDTGSVRQLDTG